MIWICPKCEKWKSGPFNRVLVDGPPKWSKKDKRYDNEVGFECPDCGAMLECHESMYDFKEERRLRKVDESG